MAGHSHAKNIKHRKDAQDAKKAKIFTKIQREIVSSIKSTGEINQEFNPRLRLAILKGRSFNMPKDKIEFAIKKATGEGAGDNFEEIRYDCYGPAGIGIIVETLTDNKNRTAGEIRPIASKYGGNLGETGSLDFIFNRIGVVLYEKNTIKFDDIFEKSVELGAENVEEFDDVYEITTQFADFHKVQSELQHIFGEPIEANIQYRAITKTELPQEKIDAVQKLIDALEDLDDVQNVWSAL